MCVCKGRRAWGRRCVVGDVETVAADASAAAVALEMVIARVRARMAPRYLILAAPLGLCM